MFIDRILDYLIKNPTMLNFEPFKTFTLESSKNIVVFKVQNVSEYYWRNKRNDWHIIDDFPNVAPVYPTMWLEWNIPRNVQVNGQWVDNFTSVTMGYLQNSFELRKDEIQTAFDRVFGGNKQDIDLTFTPTNLKWLCFGASFIEDNICHRPVYTCSQMWFVADDGTQWLPKTKRGEFIYPSIFPNTPEGKYFSELKTNLGETMNIPSLMLCFLHCKNVSVISSDIPQKLIKARENKGKLPLFSFHTLDIKPTTKIISEEGRAETKGMKFALHLCRGHFKDFSKGTGLFGRNKGLYWWDSQTRGRITEGLTLKDYKVSPN